MTKEVIKNLAILFRQPNTILAGVCGEVMHLMSIVHDNV